MSKEKADIPVEGVVILIVEDNKVNQLLVKSILRNFGFKHLDVAESGSAALNLLNTKKYDIILMDIHMPELDGHDVTRIIRGKFNDHVKHIPVIGLTAEAAAAEKQKAFAAGMNDYIVKPYTPEELLRVISKYLISKEAGSGRMESGKPASIFPLPSSRSFKHLFEYTGGDAEVTANLIEIFLLQIPDCITTIEKALPLKDWQSIYHAAHKIKSSLGIFKLDELRALIVPIEQHARNLSGLDKIPDLFNRFKKSSDVIVSALQEELVTLKNHQS